MLSDTPCSILICNILYKSPPMLCRPAGCDIAHMIWKNVNYQCISVFSESACLKPLNKDYYFCTFKAVKEHSVNITRLSTVALEGAFQKFEKTFPSH